MTETPLTGGVANPDAVVRVGDTVRRPARPNAEAVHELLRRLRETGFDGVPEPLGFDEQGREILTFIEGDVPFSPFPQWFRGREGEDFVKRHVAAGERGFVEMWNRGYGDMAERRRVWIAAHRAELIAAAASG